MKERKGGRRKYIRRLTLLNIHFKNKKILVGGKKTLARLCRYYDRTLPDVDLLGKFYAPTEKEKKRKMEKSVVNFVPRKIFHSSFICILLQL